MSRRAGLWVGFVVVHVAVAVLGFVLPNHPMGDVYLVYEPWTLQALSGAGIPGVDFTWIYPHLALVPLVLTQGLEWIAGYTVAWAIIVTLCDAAAFAVLVGNGRSRGRLLAGWFWLVFILLLGPVGMYRLDGVTVPLAIAGCLWLVGRPWLASALLAIATWIKVWPAALLAAAVIAVRQRLFLIGGALAVSAITLVAVAFAGGARHALGFVTEQTGRGLQVEAPVSGFYLWGTVLGLDGFSVYYDTDLLTYQVTGSHLDAVIAVMTPLLIVGMLALAALGAFKAWRGATYVRLFPPLALSLVLGFIVLNKVGSPQYLTWIIAPLTLGLVLDRRRWWAPALVGLVAALLTQIVYPITYGGVIGAEILAVTGLTLRNLLLVALWVWTIACLVRVPTRRVVESIRQDAATSLP